MEQIKKKHHFVWKEYLRSWTKQDDVINAYLKKQKKVAKTNLINVAQEKFFYSSGEFSDEEQIVLRKLTFHLSDHNTLSSNLSILSAFTMLTDVKRELTKRNINFKSEDFKPGGFKS